jgi:hypothetical protein
VASKVCAACKLDKPATEFHRRKAGLHSYCKPCTRLKNRQWVQTHPEQHAASCASWYRRNKAKAKQSSSNWHYKSHYSITYAEFLAMCAAVGNKCEICRADLAIGKKTARSAHLDHNHRTGVIRGVLCAMCNTAVGKLGDSPELLRRAITYLEGKTWRKRS